MIHTFKKYCLTILVLTLCASAPSYANDGLYFPSLQFPKEGVFTGFLTVKSPKDQPAPKPSDK
ncbi:hypothetical protein F9L33_02440 [Amylibacter sp. SFDW26]|uniref:hypothetical protein n=1 Tax=Amylibacter sp. SFDW26 TaxID=2652722 RepID=UPI001261C1AD|nr:hypothetical protein [Amylibacter sp. SFDW26]KAB7615639.1 hypothetical protein F9L33_02440 [Amylibacter sp. SFDW26]